ncbi:MAG: AtpZ/AtpI family protein [Candidatus Methanospirareceae archaeon]
MELNWIKALGVSFDIVITVLLCAFMGYYICGGRLHEVTPLSVIGLLMGAFLGLVVAIYLMIRMFGDGTR